MTVPMCVLGFTSLAPLVRVEKAKTLKNTNILFNGSFSVAGRTYLKFYEGLVTKPGLEIKVTSSENVEVYIQTKGNYIQSSWSGFGIIFYTYGFPGTGYAVGTKKVDEVIGISPGDWCFTVVNRGNVTANVECLIAEGDVIEVIATTISLSALSTDISQGESLTLFGKIEPNIPNVTVKLVFTRPDGSKLKKTCKTDNNGSYNAIFIPDMRGLWTVSATWAGDTEHKGASSSPLYFGVDMLPSTISCEVSSHNIVIGESVTVTGFISPALSERDIILTFEKPDGETLTRKTTTDSNSYYNISLKPEIFGKWSVTASWEGDSIYYGTSSLPVYFTLSKIYSNISCEISPPNITIGEAVNISGRIDPPRPGVPITIRYRDINSDHQFSELITVTSDSDGSYVYIWKPKSPGTYRVQAKTPVNDMYYSAFITKTLIVKKIDTKISCSVSSTEVIEGDDIIITGSIRPIELLKTVPLISLKFQSPEGREFKKYVRPFSNGSFKYVYSPKETGFWNVLAFWNGDENHTSATSQSQTFTYGKVTGNLMIIVKDEKGSLINDALVSSISMPNGQPSLSDTSDSRGTVTFMDVKWGSSVKAGETAELIITLEKEAEGGGGIPGFPYESIMLGLVLSAFMFWVMQRRR